jgi:hypothetical protein
MITILATTRQDIAKLELLCIQKTLQRKGYVNIKNNAKIYKYKKTWLLKLSPEALKALDWKEETALNEALNLPVLSVV